MSGIRPMCASCTRRFTVSSSLLVPGTHSLMIVCRSSALCPLLPTRLSSSSTPSGSPFICLSTSTTSASCSTAVDRLLQRLGASFPVKHLGPLRYFLGIEVAPNARRVILTQITIDDAELFQNCTGDNSTLYIKFVCKQMEFRCQYSESCMNTIKIGR